MRAQASLWMLHLPDSAHWLRGYRRYCGGRESFGSCAHAWAYVEASS